jgi:FAD/FMN-containing dehydrogenase
MALSRESYQALEAIVGKRNICDNMGVRETYRNIPAQGSGHYGPSEHWTPLPQAVILPKTAEEIKNIFRICNKYGIEFGIDHFLVSRVTLWNNAIQMDLRRMKSIEIDVKTWLPSLNLCNRCYGSGRSHNGLNVNIGGM